MDGKYTLKIFFPGIFSLIQVIIQPFMLPRGGYETYPPLLPQSRKVKEDIEQGSKITGKYYSGKKGPTMSHKQGG